MFTFKTKHFSMLVVALAVTVMGNSAFAQSGNQTMFLGEGVTKINMIQYQSNPTPAPGNPAGNNPTWVISEFAGKVETAAGGVNDSNIATNVVRLGTFGKSSLKGQVLSFEVVGGAIDRVNKTGDIVHTGGFTLTRGAYPAGVSSVTGNYQAVRARRVQVAALRIDLASGIIDGVITASNDWAESHTGQVIGRDDIFSIDPINVSTSLLDGVSGTTSPRSSRFDTLFVQNLQVKLAPNAATFLNTHFELTGTAAFSGGMHVGWASIFTVGVPARELPDYRDWILNY
jgi:hypothetical protein